MKKILVIFLCSLVNIAFSQRAMVEATLDTTDIKIGEQTTLNLEASVAKDQFILMPVPPDSLAFALEVVKRGTVDSILRDGQKLYTQELTITSFDSGYHAVPPLPFTLIDEAGSKKDSVYSKAILLGVHTVAVDTTQAIKDIKAPKDAPISFAEMWPYLVGLLLLLGAGFLGYRYWKQQQNKPAKTKEEPKKPLEPAHIIALRDLGQLKEAKVWQGGAYKEYYSRLTEIIRTYIEHRYEIPALEQTSDEIMFALKSLGEIETELMDKMSNCFSNADLVKFAKMLPLPEDNERDMRSAFRFVEETKVQPVITEDNTSGNISDKSVESNV